MERVQWSVLLDRKMYRGLFPDSQIRQERVFALTKSLVAVRQSRVAA